MAEVLKSDFLVIGSGIAGLFFAKKAAEYFTDSRVTILTKDAPSESNTLYAQGGIASVLDQANDSFEKHIEDTLTAGDGICNREVVEMVIRKSPEVLNELLHIGVEFDRDEGGAYHLAKEGGHSEKRIMHRKDQTGKELEEKLLFSVSQLPNVRIISHCMVLELLIDKGQCFGLTAIQILNQQLMTCFANTVVIASGGAGQVYRHTTNPTIATGDGIAMAYRAGAVIKDMEFVQFHPTAFYHDEAEKIFLVSEAVRGAGAVLKNADGEAFMGKYHHLKDLAPRDSVSRAIHREMMLTKKGYVYLDCQSIGQERFAVLFPHIYKRCLEFQIVPGKDMIPVAPAAHYMCGGIETGLYGETNIKNLFACGESACTGMHGANRLASNSLLEAIVFAQRIFEYVQIHGAAYKNGPLENHNQVKQPSPENTSRQQLLHLRSKLRSLMSIKAGIIKSNAGLASLLTDIEQIQIEIQALKDKAAVVEWYETFNLSVIAGLIAVQALNRKVNKGVFYNEDLSIDELQK